MGAWLFFFFFFFFFFVVFFIIIITMFYRNSFINAFSVCPDQTLRSVASDLGLHCLSMSFL